MASKRPKGRRLRLRAVASGAALKGVGTLRYIISPPRIGRDVPLTSTAGAVGLASLNSILVKLGVGPMITGVSPSHAVAGASVTITGSGFGTTRGTSTVRFGPVAAAAYSSWSNTSIIVIVPSGSGDIQVIVGGVASNTVSFSEDPPVSALNVVDDYGATGNGVTNDSPAIQAAINALGTGGGDIYFPAGTYLLNSTLQLPAGNTARLTLWGYDATIKLSGNTGFLNLNRTAEYQSFRYFTVRGFDIDGTNRSSSAGCWIIGCYNYGGALFVYRGNVEYITLQDIYAYGCPARIHEVVSYGVALGTKHGSSNEATMTYVRHITIDNVTILGGDTGILVSAQISGAPVPAYMNAELDDVNISNVHFDSGKVPPFGSMMGNTGIMVNQAGRGGTVTVTDCFCKGTEDDLFEFNSCADVTLTRCSAVESYDLCFTFRNQGYYILGGTVAKGNQNLKYIDCHAERGRETYDYDAIGYATLEVDGSDIHYTRTHWHEHDGTIHYMT